VREVEHGVFTPLIFSSSGGMAREATVFYKRLAELVSLKQYSMIMGWLRCQLSFTLLRSAILYTVLLLEDQYVKMMPLLLWLRWSYSWTIN